MKQEYYNALPKTIKKRADKYMSEAKALTDEWFGMDNGSDTHKITVQIATAMMNMESAEVIASQITKLSKRIGTFTPDE